MKSKSTIFGGVLLLFLLLTSTATAKVDHTWGNYHWARSGVVNLRLGDNLSSAWKSAPNNFFQTAIADWNRSTVIELFPEAGGVNPKRCPIVGGMVQVCNSSYGRTGWLGVAGISATNGHITGAYVKLNDTYSMTAAEKQLVMCQEIGHTFGLGHQDEGFNNPPLGTCMDYTSTATAPENMHPNAHDYELLEQIYAHSDTTSTISSMAVPAEVALADYRSPRAWGRVIRVSREGNPMVFRRDFPNGHQVFTFVFPVPGGRLADEEHDGH